MSDKPWKRRERAVAKWFGVKRIPVAVNSQDEQGRDGADVISPPWAMQVKHGYRLPTYLKDWLTGIRRVGASKGLTGVVVWAGKGQRTSDAVVVMAFEDWQRRLSHAAPPSKCSSACSCRDQTLTSTPDTTPAACLASPTSPRPWLTGLRDPFSAPDPDPGTTAAHTD